jgi:hypothetical protein
MSLEFLPLTVQSQVLCERFVYVPQRVTFPVVVCLCVVFV